MSNNTGMVVITDLITLQDFFEHAVQTLGGVDIFRPVSVGPEGIQEIAKFFESEVKPGQLVCTYQVAETPLSDNGAGLTTATFACTLMLMKKMGGAVQTPTVKLAARDATWKKMLRLIGLIRQASEWYATEVTEVDGQDYEVIFNIYQDKLLPLGKIANANIQGWLIDIDVSIPVNGLMYV
jgi:hypothetical protein